MSSIPSPMPSKTEIALPARLVALVVDDDPQSLIMVSDALEAMGITVMTARDGEAALHFARTLKPDVVLLDAVMPRIDGFETCRRLKSPPLSLEAPVIFMTGLTASEHVVEGLRAGGVDYVTKPLDLDELSARLTVHLLNAQQLNSARQALDSNGRAVIAIDGQQIAWASPRAHCLLKDAPGLLSEGQVEGACAAWLAGLRGTPLSQTTSFRHDRVELTYLGLSAFSEILLSIRSRTPRSRETVLRDRFALTEREADVLLWLTQGKTNQDIGQILGLSARTVNKHLEQVFQKMGVDNRTAAAVMADRVLWAD